MSNRALSLAVVGADHANQSGPLRRFEIAMCKPGEPVKLVREPRNPADPNAVAVFSARDIQIGYIRAERAPMIGTAMRRGVVTAVFQQREAWGATIRVNLDGGTPTLPVARGRNESSLATSRMDGQDWWPDEEWPD